jgi:TM2 domain-containing membrane protein YozV
VTRQKPRSRLPAVTLDDMESDQLRIGTAEREEAARLLADHFGMGRITPDEYETRVTDAYAATTLGDLRPLFRDLPQPHPGFFGPPPMPTVPAPMPYAPPPMPMPMSMSMPVPYAQHPVPYSYRSKTVAGVLQIVLPFGVGRFYTGQTGLGLLQLFVVLATGIGVLWPIIDGITLLAKGGLDADGRPLRP